MKSNLRIEPGKYGRESSNLVDSESPTKLDIEIMKLDDMSKQGDSFNFNKTPSDRSITKPSKRAVEFSQQRKNSFLKIFNG